MINYPIPVKLLHSLKISNKGLLILPPPLNFIKLLHSLKIFDDLHDDIRYEIQLRVTGKPIYVQVFKVFSIYDLGLVTSPSIFAWLFLPWGHPSDSRVGCWHSGTLRFCLPCGKMALPQVGRLTHGDQMALGGGHQKDPLKAEPMKSSLTC